MKKQVKKLSKKILILSIATSLIFTTCFTSKKIEVKASSIVATLSAYSLYEICLYFGGLAISALGLGYAYENRDDIAEFGKSIIDSMTSLPENGWLFGSYSADSSYVYGSEALQEVKGTEWSVIQGGGQSPKNDDDEDGDGDKDAADRTLELDLTGYFLTQAGANFFNDSIKPVYDKWANGSEDDIVNPALGVFNYNDIIIADLYGANDKYRAWDQVELQNLMMYGKPNVFFDGFYRSVDGYYLGYYNVNYYSDGQLITQRKFVISDAPVALCYIHDASKGCVTIGFKRNPNATKFSGVNSVSDWDLNKWNDRQSYIQTNLPLLTTYGQVDAFTSSGYISGVTDQPKVYRVADWIADDDAWKGHLEDLATSLRSLQDLTSIAQQLSEGALATQPSANEYADMMNNLGTEIAPLTNPISDPIYYPATNTTPLLEPSQFPNYVPTTTPDVQPDSPSGSNSSEPDAPQEDVEIDLDGLLSLFNILFYLIMIIIMLIFLFLECLAFIVMIFRIPSSSAMLPEEMVLGLEHLKTIMIPGMNISIYGFAMALIYMFIVFGVIKVLRREISTFKFPRSYK